jgi:hypothetical protein
MTSDHIKRMIPLTGDNIKRLSLYLKIKFIPLLYVSKVLRIFAETYYSQEVMAQAMDLSYDEAFSFGQAFWNDAESEIHLSLVAVDENGETSFVFLNILPRTSRISTNVAW